MYPYLLLSQGGLCPLNEGHTRPDTAGPSESQGDDGGPSTIPGSTGPLSSGPTTAWLLSSLQFGILLEPAPGCQRLQTPSPPTTAQLLSKVKILGWDRKNSGHGVARRPRGHTLPRYRKKELLVNAFKCFWGQRSPYWSGESSPFNTCTAV